MYKPVRRLWRRARNLLCYWLVEYLEEYTERQSGGTMAAAADAIAVSAVLDVPQALRRDIRELPLAAADALGAFSEDQWRDVIRSARETERQLERDLDDPRWTHLRRKH